MKTGFFVFVYSMGLCVYSQGKISNYNTVFNDSLELNAQSMFFKIDDIRESVQFRYQFSHKSYLFELKEDALILSVDSMGQIAKFGFKDDLCESSLSRVDALLERQKIDIDSVIKMGEQQVSTFISPSTNIEFKDNQLFVNSDAPDGLGVLVQLKNSQITKVKIVSPVIKIDSSFVVFFDLEIMCKKWWFFKPKYMISLSILNNNDFSKMNPVQYDYRRKLLLRKRDIVL